MSRFAVTAAMPSASTTSLAQAQEIVRRQAGDFPVAASVLGKLGNELAASGLGFADVVKMNVFLVGDSATGGRMDFDGLMRAYNRYVGAASRGNLPARTTVRVAGVPVPGALVEVGVIAARVPRP